jgi:hypothetical protein
MIVDEEQEIGPQSMSFEVVWRNPLSKVRADLKAREKNNPYCRWAEQASRIRVRRWRRRSTITTTTFAALQNVSCTEARQGLSELRPLSNPGEGAAVPSRKTNGRVFAILWTGAQWQHRR